MKKYLKIFCLVTVAMSSMSPAHAYKFVIFTDEAVTNRSNEVADLLKTTYPFNQFDIEVEVVQVPASELACESSQGIERLVSCTNEDEIQSAAMKRGGDQAMVIKNMSTWGGSSAVGSGVPVMTSGASARVMLHEYLHTLGLCDEYEYPAEEAGFYCNTERARPNLVFIEPKEPFAGDMVARTMHGGQIPWYDDIAAQTPITNLNGMKFGTGAVDFQKKAAPNTSAMPLALEEPTGVYKGKICNSAKPPRPSWHPGATATVMENVDAGLGAPLERIVERVLVSKGIRKKMQIDETREVAVKEESKGGEVVVTPEPDATINNSDRGFLKSLLQWLQGIFDQIGSAISR